MPNRKDERLRYLVGQAALRDGFMANTLLHYRDTERLTEDELIAFLGCSEADYIRIALCTIPDADAPGFRQKLERIVDSTGVSAGRLAQIIRHVNASAVLQQAVSEAEVGFRSGELLAARDREEPTEPSKSRELELPQEPVDEDPLSGS
jgi:hypothetical protein